MKTDIINVKKYLWLKKIYDFYCKKSVKPLWKMAKLGYNGLECFLSYVMIRFKRYSLVIDKLDIIRFI